LLAFKFELQFCVLFDISIQIRELKKKNLNSALFSNGSSVSFEQEEQNRGKPNWEHLNEDLHVLITVEDSQNRAEIKLKRAVEEVKKLLVPAVSILSL